jgi:LruC domain-containing protein
MKNYLLATLLMLSLLFQGCLKHDNTEVDVDDMTIANAIIPSDFNYSTQKDITIKLTIPDFLKSAVVSICTYKTGTDSAQFARATFDDTGYLEAKYTISANIDSLVVVSEYLGLTKNVYIPITGSTAEFDYTSFYEDESSKSAYIYPEQLKSTSADSYTYMGNYDSDGVPEYLIDSDEIEQNLLDDINSSLPEQQWLTKSHPEYLEAGKASNIELSDDADVWITFVTEGAGWKNALGYYTYDLDNEPQTAADIDKLTIIFPNASQSGSGGGLIPGNKVHLGKFSANTGIGWFLVANGWNTSSKTVSGSTIRYSHTDFNTESDDDLKQHMVMLYDNARELIILGFEDMTRTSSGCDHDFNDAVFYATANPITAIVTDNVSTISTSNDSDGDGINDELDDFPDDADKAFNNFSPSTTSNGTLAFEDLWPSTGDYDFNDCVLSYNFNLIANSSNNITNIEAWFVLTNDGAAFENGFGFVIDDIEASQIKSIEGQKMNVGYVIRNTNGTESSVDEAVVFVTENVKPFLNDTININIALETPLSSSELGSVPFNPFLISNGNREKEIHLADMSPTSKGTTYLGSNNDTSNSSEDRYFKTNRNLPWGLNIYESFTPSSEGVSIDKTYSKFISWANSGGEDNQDWYEN